MHDEKAFWDNYWHSRIEYEKSTKHLFEDDFKWGFFCNRKLFEHYQSVAGNLRGQHILEWGAGSGYTSFLAARAGAVVTVMDYSDQSIEYMKIVARFLGVENKVRMVKGDLSDLPETIKYDLVWNCGVIEHYSDDEIISQTKTASKLTKSGGLIIFTLPNLRSPEGIFRRLKSKVKGEQRSERDLTPNHVKSIFTAANLQDVRAEPVHYYIPSFVPGRLALTISNRLPLTRVIPNLAWLYSLIGKVR